MQGFFLYQAAIPVTRAKQTDHNVDTQTLSAMMRMGIHQ